MKINIPKSWEKSILAGRMNQVSMIGRYDLKVGDKVDFGIKKQCQVTAIHVHVTPAPVRTNISFEVV